VGTIAQPTDKRAKKKKMHTTLRIEKRDLTMFYPLSFLGLFDE
jgi:hypothetical protein